ncbi:transmembrane protein 183 [Thrips palmi]|uniref:Transmembrane protein 183 n=1 Tax=Thrips palmi TaxID=161013 RepID=A0A6P8ZVD8_THRPL|nr:transmembrane protein 183 [Thrips palmi]
MSHRKGSKPMLGDVSIYNYADAQVASRRGRLSKAVTTPIAEVERLNRRGDGLRWEQRQQRLDDTDADEDFEARVTSRSRTLQNDDAPKPFLVLPMDIWFAIGDHIPPESVKAFACICKDTQKVTNSARFWFGLYRRFYDPAHLQTLPSRLQPEKMKAVQGLKASVIQSLFIMYPPFIERLKPRPGKIYDLQPILRRKCISTWYTQKGKIWTYWFKLKQINVRVGRGLSLLSHGNKKLLQMEQDLATNEEKDSKVLQVSCSQYLPLPAVHGLLLKKALITVSQDMMAHKLTLTFDSTDIVIDPASNIQILDWWHPQYPHTVYQLVKKNITLSLQDKDNNNVEAGLLIDHWYNV